MRASEDNEDEARAGKECRSGRRKGWMDAHVDIFSREPADMWSAQRTAVSIDSTAVATRTERAPHNALAIGCERRTDRRVGSVN